jgi:hypothetical protein
MSNYEEITNDLGFKSIIKTNDDGSLVIIPLDPANSDYQAYLNKDNPDWNKPNII